MKKNRWAGCESSHPTCRCFCMQRQERVFWGCWGRKRVTEGATSHGPYEASPFVLFLHWIIEPLPPISHRSDHVCMSYPVNYNDGEFYDVFRGKKNDLENRVRHFIYSVGRWSVCTALCAHGLQDCIVTFLQDCLLFLVIHPAVNLHIQCRARAHGRTYLNRHLCTIFTVPHDDTKFN